MYRQIVVLAWCLMWGCNPTVGALRMETAAHRFQGVERESGGAEGFAGKGGDGCNARHG